MRRLRTWMLVALAACLAAPAAARAELIELVGGRVVEGTVVAGQTSDEGLALRLFDTDGTILIRWDHILPARKTQLRVELGLDAPLEDEVLVPGHIVRLTTGKVMEGLALNPDRSDQPLQIKTRTGVASVDRSMVAGTEETSLPGLAVYTAAELYDRLRDADPPDSAAKHLELAQKCMKIGALDQGKQHLDAAAADAAFATTPEGRKIPRLQRQMDLLLRSKGAQDQVAQIEAAVRAKRWNDAVGILDQLDEQCQDEVVRDLIHFNMLKSKVERGRVDYFRKEVQKRVYSAMDRLIETKAREKKPLRPDTEQKRGVATPGTLASARQWLAKDLHPQIWEKVGADLGLKAEEVDQFWKDRTGKGRTTTYGTGTFIVAKKPTAAKPGQNPDRQRRPPGSTREPQGGAGSQRQTKEDKPKTDEEWWDEVGPGDRARWLTALYAETGGDLTVVRVDETELCDTCGGKGVQTSNNADGSIGSTVCTKCNGSQKFRRVHYR